MNKTFEKVGKDILKGLLSQCTEPQQYIFKRMYSHTNLDIPINDAVDNMDPTKIDQAITQCERTVEKNKLS
jgi:hypothetical protein